MSKINQVTTTSLSRRKALAGLSVAIAAGAAALPAAADADPVYAAIKRERDAFADYCITYEAQSRINDQNPLPLSEGDNYEAVRKAVAKRRASPEFEVWWARYEEAEDAHTVSAQKWWSAREDFLQTQPTTSAGLFAFLDHIDGPFTSAPAGEACWDEHEWEMAFPTLAGACRNLITRKL
jgi:hypothetical protein